MCKAAGALFLFLVWNVGQAETAWRYAPQHEFSGFEAPVYADLDGDGAKEIVYIASPWYRGTNGIAVLRSQGQTFVPVDLQAFGIGHGGLVAVPGPNGRDRVIITVGDSNEQLSLLELGGLPLRVVRDVGRNNFHVSAAADVDADGELELVGRPRQPGFPPLVVLDYRTGVQEWSALADFQANIAVAQLDAEAALEIIVGGTPGQVFDGLTGSIDWSYAGGFTGRVISGRFAGDISIPTFASLDVRLQVFRGMPFSPLRELWLDVSPSYGDAIDMNGDGLDELAVFRRYSDGLTILDPLTGAQTSVLPELADSTPYRVGRIVPAGPVVTALSGSDIGASTWARARVVDLTHRTTLYDRKVEPGPFTSVAYGDVEGDGTAHVFMITPRVPDGTRGAWTNVLSVWTRSGVKIAEREDAVPYTTSDTAPLLHLADIDGQPGDEIVLAYAYGVNIVRVLDGRTLQDRWQFTDDPQPQHPKPVHLKSSDFDNDGIRDPVFLEQSHEGSRVVVVSGRDGSLIWRSVTIGVDAWSVGGGLMLHNIDADPGEEVLVAIGRVVYAFDPGTRLLEWALPLPQDLGRAFRLTAWGQGEDCRFAVAMEAGPVATHRCDDQSRTGLQDAPLYPAMMVPLDDAGAIALAAEDRVWTMAPGQAAEPQAGFFGWRIGGMEANALHVDSRGERHLLVGSHLLAAETWLRGPEIFSNGFESH